MAPATAEAPSVGFVSIEKLADDIGVPVTTIRSWRAKFDLPYVRVGGRLLFDPKAVRRWLEAR